MAFRSSSHLSYRPFIAIVKDIEEGCDFYQLSYLSNKHA